MLTGWRSEAGVTLVELLVAMSMLMVVLVATFAAFDGYGRATRANFKQNHAQSIARTTADRMARELRNVGSPGFSGAPVERADPNDVIFNRVEPSGAGGASNVTKVARVRYCFAPAERKIWRQVETWNGATRPVLPSTTSCPAPPFGPDTLVTEHVVNGASRPLFTYDSSTLANIAAVEVEIYTDLDVNQPPGEQRLSTQIFLRNQNRAPIADFTASTTGNRHVLLNASGSSDPDGDALTYKWYDGGILVGEGPLLDYVAPSAGNRVLSVSVTDPAGLVTTSPSQTVNVQ